MNAFLQKILSMSEVWALFFPLLVLVFYKINRPRVKEIIFYLWISLVLNTIIVVLTFLPDYFDTKDFPFLLQNNTIEYNILSAVRVTLFTFYFIRNGQESIKLLLKIILIFFLVFVLLNFLFLESPVNMFSSRLFTAEAVVLLFYCIYFYLNSINQEKNESLRKQPMFWIVTGLSIYEAVNFTIFLLFTYLIRNYTFFAQHIWNIHNISFIILCLFITKAFYAARRQL